MCVTAGVHVLVGGQATRVKLKQKQAEGIAEARSGRRSVVGGCAFILWPTCCIRLSHLAHSCLLRISGLCCCVTMVVAVSIAWSTLQDRCAV